MEAKRSHLEDDIQMGIFQWAFMHEKKWPCLRWLHHVRNEGRISAISDLQRMIKGLRYKKMGVKRGILDIFLPYPRNGFCGLHIEVKTPNGRLTKEQSEYIDYLESNNYATAVVRSIDEGVRVISEYISK